VRVERDNKTRKSRSSSRPIVTIFLSNYRYDFLLQGFALSVTA